MTRLLRRITSASLFSLGEALIRGSEALDRGDDDRPARIIPPAKVGRWAIWEVPLHPAAEDYLLGRYRTRWVAELIARRMVVTHNVMRYEVRPVDRRATVTGS
ncbi:hypothetical protein GCM10010435_44120 [Winogradskya consettensis]|uniref:Uncharacterized protein n=1 Tax=Winogradskya consettensis TaxID=113560 RepID=A0A919T0P3_9ACTN|nr:hypothetical protein [Actinoplanes consettensis]GIM82637.1 hypothetical protein Aco04nite_82510 [Actinoplanes consettensis]